MGHLLVTNDFPPKVGGIQTVLWELWRRLPSDGFTVFTTPYAGAAEWDARQPFRVVRSSEPVLLPTPSLARRIDRLAAEVGADYVLLDPALPLGHLGPQLKHPYGVVVHGAEITVPGRLPGSRQLLSRVLRHAQLVVAIGGYPAAEAQRAAGRSLPTVVVPPGVDAQRFRPLDDAERVAARAKFGLARDDVIVACVSRLVPRKGFDVVIEALGLLAPHRPDLRVVVAGGGRDRERLETLATRLGAPVTFLGRVPEDDLALVYGMSDVFAMCCRNRWAGLEQEGFGIVFLEAAACGIPQVAGDSGGAAEAVEHGVSGLVVDDPLDHRAVADAIARLVDDPDLRRRMGSAARARAEREFTYDVLAGQLAGHLYVPAHG
ncbi:MAG: glycosyltransferase family 4 protein [Acidimicrobiia bacterium]